MRPIHPSLFRVVTFTVEPHPSDPKRALAHLQGTGYTVVIDPESWGEVREGLFLLPRTIVPTSRAPFEGLPVNTEHPRGGPGHRVQAERIGGVLSHGVLVPLTLTFREARAGGASDVQIEERFGIVSGLDPAFLPVELREPDHPNFPMPPAPRDWRDDPAAIPLQAPVRVREWLADPLWRAALVKTDSGVSYRVGGLDAVVDPAGNTLYARAARENLPMPTLVRAYHQWLQRAHPTMPLPADRLADLDRYFLVLGVFTNETPTSLCLTDLIVDGTVQPHAELRALAALVGLRALADLYVGPYTPTVPRLANRASTLYAGRGRDGIEILPADTLDFEAPRYVIPSEDYLRTAY